MFAGERAGGLAGFSLNDATTEQQQRLFCPLDCACGRVNIFLIGFGRRFGAGRKLWLAGFVVCLLEAHVFREIDQRWTGATGFRECEGLANGVADGVGRGREPVVLGQRHRHTGRVGFLERIRADHVAGNLPGKGDHRIGVHVGVGETGDEIGRTGARGCQRDAGLVGDNAVGVGGVGRTLLVGHGDVLDI
ncbi:MAG: hypothetical protein J07HN6_01423 [Halonotius sp. J07HN6]|nr:MAG: hypothetical protein J07HN6_01423 [Halonotius sp. J07HN6]ERH05300.1 MAG: hypothetical protein J07HN4v3_00895 [Halonotius sp. J07HN4]